jgi:hypothetical protein
MARFLQVLCAPAAPRMGRNAQLPALLRQGCACVGEPRRPLTRVFLQPLMAWRDAGIAQYLALGGDCYLGMGSNPSDPR